VFLNPHVVSCFSLSHLLSELYNLVAGGLYEVPATYLGSLGYFPAWGPVRSNGRPSERLLLMGVQYVQPS
jgi:hypothetical protein